MAGSYHMCFFQLKMSHKALRIGLPMLTSFLRPSENGEPSLHMAIWRITIISLSVLFTSIQLPLNTTALHTRQFAARDLLGPFAISLLSSIYVAKQHFLVVHIIVICVISPNCYSSIMNLIERSLCWFWDTLKAKCVSRRANDHNQEPEVPSQTADTTESVDNEGDPRHPEQPNLEGGDNEGDPQHPDSQTWKVTMLFDVAPISQ